MSPGDALERDDDRGIDRRLLKVELCLETLQKDIGSLERRIEEQHEDVMGVLGSILDAKTQQHVCIRTAVERLTNPKVLLVLAVAVLVFVAGSVGAGVTLADWLEVTSK